ncbi:MAG: acetylornithine deacetylase [Gammaproteobacteria bacterium]
MTQIPDLKEQISRLISQPSVSSVNPLFDQGNAKVTDLLASWLAELGFEIEIQTLPGQPDKSNLIATLGKGPGGLVLAGHTDTVPFDEGRWKHDPFKLTEADQRFYGLGTSDMKAFLAIAIEAARSFTAKQLTAPLMILATADEESSMGGAKLLVESQRPQADYAVIGEPTGMRPIRMHKGIMMESIRLIGQSGHSSDPSLGNNALEAMHRVITDLMTWRRELQSDYHNPLFSVPTPTMNFGHIHGGDNPNRICADCELQIDLRPLPGMDIVELRQILHARLQGLFQDSPITLDFQPLFEGTPAMETSATSPIVQATEKLTGYAAGAVAFGTEGPYFNQMGMNTVIMGPGDIDQAHQPDEFLALDRIQPTVEILKKLINHFCVGNTVAKDHLP